MNRPLALALLVAGFVAATSPVWAADTGLVFAPDPAHPGQSVAFSAGVDPTHALEEDPCMVTVVKGEPTPADAGCGFLNTTLLTGYVVLPTDAPTGAPYTIEVCGGCAPEFEYLQTGAVSVVASPLSPPTSSATVPTSHCSEWSQTYKRLYAVGLHLVGPRFPEPIWYLRPSGGAVVARGTEVTPYPALVPSLDQLSYPSATALVIARCGDPTPIGPAEGVVVGQDPLPGIALPTDRVVRVSLSPTPTPPPPPPTTSTLTTDGTSGSGNEDGGHHGHHRAWWKRAALPTGGAAGLAALVFLGLHQRRIHRPATPMAYDAEIHIRDNGGDAAWEPPRPGRLTPSFVLRQHTTYTFQELS